KEGFLAKPEFVIIRDESRDQLAKDPLKVMEKMLYNNPAPHKLAAQMANRLVNEENKGVLLMIDRISQFSLLERHLRVKDFGFAYGSLTTDQKKHIPSKYHGLDSSDEVKRFNNG